MYKGCLLEISICRFTSTVVAFVEVQAAGDETQCSQGKDTLRLCKIPLYLTRSSRYGNSCLLLPPHHILPPPFKATKSISAPSFTLAHLLKSRPPPLSQTTDSISAQSIALANLLNFTLDPLIIPSGPCSRKTEMRDVRNRKGNPRPNTPPPSSSSSQP